MWLEELKELVMFKDNSTILLKRLADIIFKRLSIKNSIESSILQQKNKSKELQLMQDFIG